MIETSAALLLASVYLYFGCTVTFAKLIDCSVEF